MHMQNRNRLIDKENEVVVIKGKSEMGRDNYGYGTKRYKLLCIDKQQEYTVSHREL